MSVQSRRSVDRHLLPILPTTLGPRMSFNVYVENPQLHQNPRRTRWVLPQFNIWTSHKLVAIQFELGCPTSDLCNRELLGHELNARNLGTSSSKSRAVGHAKQQPTPHFAHTTSQRSRYICPVSCGQPTSVPEFPYLWPTPKLRK